MSTLSASHPVVVPGTKQSAFPAFLHRRKEGIFIDLAKLVSEANFQAFVTDLFEQGLRFSGLDYQWLQNLAYKIGPRRPHSGEVRLAQEIVIFAASRKALYKEVRMMEGGARAEYMFEPVFLEVIFQEPRYGEPDASGNAAITGYQERTRTQPTMLDFDEFVADMWIKVVRFGLDMQAFENGITRRKADRVVVATELKPVEGRDAELQEECEFPV